MFRCLDLSDSAEGLGQVNEIKDTQRCFFHFPQSSKVVFEEGFPTVGLGGNGSCNYSLISSRKPLDSITIYNCNEQWPLSKDFRSPISWEYFF